LRVACCSVMQVRMACCSVLQCVAVCCSVLQCVAVYQVAGSVLQSNAVWQGENGALPCVAISHDTLALTNSTQPDKTQIRHRRPSVRPYTRVYHNICLHIVSQYMSTYCSRE